MKQLYVVVFSIVSVIVLGAFSATRYNGDFKNLKVLPKNIPAETLDSIMHTYTQSLGVNCSFCHTAKGDDIDFVSDENPTKEVARNMMRMTIDINQKYFNYDSTIHPVYLNIVTCNTCHKGDAYPKQ